MYKWIADQVYEDGCYIMLFDSNGLRPGLNGNDDGSCSKHGYNEYVGTVYCLTEDDFSMMLYRHKTDNSIAFPNWYMSFLTGVRKHYPPENENENENEDENGNGNENDSESQS